MITGATAQLEHDLVALALVKVNDFSGAKEATARIARVENSVKSSGIMWVPIIYGEITTAQLKAGELAGAIESAAQIRDMTPAKPLAYARIAAAQAEAGDIDGYRASIVRAEEAATVIESKYSPHYSKSVAYTSIAEAKAKAGDMAGFRASMVRAARLAALSKNLKSAALKLLTETYARVGDINGAERAAAAQAQAKAEEEIKWWTDKVLNKYDYISRPEIIDLQSFLLSLVDKKNPIDVLSNVADAATSMSIVLKELRKGEAFWQKNRAEAAK